MTVLRRFDCVLAEREPRVFAEYKRLSARGIEGQALGLQWRSSPTTVERLRSCPLPRYKLAI